VRRDVSRRTASATDGGKVCLGGLAIAILGVGLGELAVVVAGVQPILKIKATIVKIIKARWEEESDRIIISVPQGRKFCQR